MPLESRVSRIGDAGGEEIEALGMGGLYRRRSRLPPAQAAEAARPEQQAANRTCGACGGRSGRPMPDGGCEFRVHGDAMRRLLDLIALGLLIVLLLGVVFHHRASAKQEQSVRMARLSVDRIQAEVDLLRALGRVRTNESGHPVGVDPRWFEGELPLNPLLADGRPWLDLAKPGEITRRHPWVWQVDDGGEAMFWYNPVQGVVRARVPRQQSEERARRLYAEVNGVWLD